MIFPHIVCIASVRLHYTHVSMWIVSAYLHTQVGHNPKYEKCLFCPDDSHGIVGGIMYCIHIVMTTIREKKLNFLFLKPFLWGFPFVENIWKFAKYYTYCVAWHMNHQVHEVIWKERGKRLPVLFSLESLPIPARLITCNAYIPQHLKICNTFTASVYTWQCHAQVDKFTPSYSHHFLIVWIHCML